MSPAPMRSMAAPCVAASALFRAYRVAMRDAESLDG